MTKFNYLYTEKELIKKPYYTIFLKLYNDNYGGSKTYAVLEKLQKEDKLIDPHAKQIIIFYESPITETEVKENIKKVKLKILENLKESLDTVEVSEATEQDLLKHQKNASETKTE